MQPDFLSPDWLFAPVAARVDADDYPGNVLRQYRQRARLAGLSALLVRSSATSLAGYQYIFYGTKYADIILSLPKQQVLIVGGPSEWRFCRKHGLAFYSFIAPYQAVAEAIGGGDTAALERCYQRLRSDFAQCPARFLVSSNDVLPATRFLIGALRATLPGLKLVCIQHGVYQSGYQNRFNDGHISDLNLVYDQHQGDILIRCGIPAETIRLFGFHSDHAASEAAPEEPRICLVGEGWHKFNARLGDRHFALMKQLKRDLAARGRGATYRPHPNEGSLWVMRHFGKIDRRPLAACFERFDLFIGVCSTLLLEANMAGKCAVQIRDPGFDVDDYSALGYCQAFDHADVDAILAYYQAWRTKARAARSEPVGSRFLQVLAQG